MSVLQRVTWLLAAAVLTGLVGCGGSGGGGVSLSDRYKKALKIPGAEKRAQELIKVAKDQHQAQDSAGTKASLLAAEKACAEVDAANGRAAAYTDLAAAFLLVGNARSAKAALKPARDAAKTIEEESSDDIDAKAVIYVDMAKAQFGVDNEAFARAHLRDDVERLARKHPTARGKAAILVRAAQAYHLIGDAAKADETLAAAVQSAKTIEEDDKRIKALLEIAGAQRKRKQTAAAGATYDEALALARQIEKPESRANLLVDIAGQWLATDKQRAAGVLDEAERIAKTIKDPAYQQEALQRIAHQKNKL